MTETAVAAKYQLKNFNFQDPVAVVFVIRIVSLVELVCSECQGTGSNSAGFGGLHFCFSWLHGGGLASGIIAVNHRSTMPCNSGNL